MLCLRPHHALCIQKYTGHGYDEAFTRHMDELTAALRRQPDTPVRLTEGCDGLCTACPHNAGGVCATAGKVRHMDEAVLRLCGYACGQELPWRELAGEAARRIFETPDFETVCGDCEWVGLCRETGRF